MSIRSPGPWSLMLPTLAAITAALPALPAISLNLTGCWEMGASNGRLPPPGCGTAPLDSGDGLVYLRQTSAPNDTDPSVNLVDACLWQSCYRPATGRLINTSTGTGMLRLRTLTGAQGVGNCTAPRFPPDGLLEHFNWILPVGWPTNGTKARGTNVPASDLSGTFVNDGTAAGVAGGIFLRRSADPTACDHMRALPDCAVPAAGGNALRDPAPPPPPPPPVLMPPESNRNMTGCYRFGGSAGIPPPPECGISIASSGNGMAFVSHRPEGSVRVCLNQFCSRRLSGNFSTASNGVSFMTLATDFGVGNCTRAVSSHFPKAGLFAHIDFVVPAGWPESGTKTKGAHTNGTHTITGMFVNNGRGLVGMLTMDPGVDPGECDRLHELPFCADFVPSMADRANDQN